MYANNQLAGTDTAFPDVCNTEMGTGPVPMPYSNTASGSLGTPAAYKVFLGGAPAHNLTTVVSVTNGDEAGVYGGVSSGRMMGTSMHALGANTVLVGGSPVTRLSSTTMQNGTNASGSRLAPSQAKVLVLAP